MMLSSSYILIETMLPMLLWTQVFLTVQALADPVPFLIVLDEDASSIPDCQEEGLESCVKVEIDFDAFYNETSLLFPGGVALERNIRIDGTGGSYSYTYQAQGAGTIILTYTNSDGIDALDGTINLGPTGFYTLENCGEKCHVLGKENDAKTHPVDNDENDDGSLPPSSRSISPEHGRLLELGRSSDLAVMTIQIYYTPAFEKVTSNIQSFLNNEVALVNVGYKQSLIDLQLKIHCIKKIELTEPSDPHQRIENFKNAISPLSKLYNSADIAVLYTATNIPSSQGYFTCGRVEGIDSINYDNPRIAWVSKNCENILSHEIGHMFGLRHDRLRDSRRDMYDDSHGFVLGGFHTIMAYASASAPTAINYYSNTILTYQGEIMGNSLNNNRRILQLTRFIMAGMGDEGTSCDGVRVTASGLCYNANTDRNCCYWVDKGYCTHTWVDFMKANCARSCHHCCANSFYNGDDCTSRVTRGDCTGENADYMKCYCPKSCGHCQ